MNETARPVRRSHRNRLAATLAALSLVLLVSGCGNPLAKSSAEPVCADKVMQSITTNKPVNGLWNCLDSKLQSSLAVYQAEGLLNPDKDGVFTDPTIKVPTGFMTYQFIAESHGVAIYTVEIPQGSGKPPLTVTVTIWIDLDGKVSNMTIAGPSF